MNGSAVSQDQIADMITKGQQLLQAGELAQSEALYRRVLQHEPRNLDALHLLGIIAHRSGKLDIAADFIAKAIQENPSIPNFYLNLGNVFRDQSDLDQAGACYQKALQLNPNYAKAHNNLGVIFREQEKLDDSLICFQKALQIDPNYMEACVNIGITLQAQGKLGRAIEYFLKVIRLKPDYAEAHASLGTALKEQGELALAVSCFENALRLNPDYATAHWNRSGALLRMGDFLHGWQDYEWRWKTENVDSRKRNFPQPWWRGENLAGKTILIWGEQGIGDELLFANMLPDIITQAGHCVIECDPRLVPLFARSFSAAEIIPRSNPPHPRTIEPDIHFQVPMGNLAQWFRSSLDAFPRHCGYLIADPLRVAHWKECLTALGKGRKVGICWRSMLRNASRDMHYTQLNQWEPILTTPGILFINLQYDGCKGELEAAARQFGINIHDFTEIDLLNDLDEAAALTSALDLVISAPTSVATMAGALGTLTWKLVRDDDWASFGTNYVPWFPQMTSFSRSWNVGWENAILEISNKLAQFSAGEMFDAK